MPELSGTFTRPALRHSGRSAPTEGTSAGSMNEMGRSRLDASTQRGYREVSLVAPSPDHTSMPRLGIRKARPGYQRRLRDHSRARPGTNPSSHTRQVPRTKP